MNNKFFEIPEYSDYLISKDGLVYSNKSSRLLTIHTNTRGYKYVTFSISGKNKNLLLHRLLAYMFLDLKSLDATYIEVDHIDRDKTNNSLDNLQVLSQTAHRNKTVADNGFNIREQKYCTQCGEKINYANKSGICIKHIEIGDSISIDQIEYWVKNYSWTRASKELGMTDNGLRKLYFRKTGKDPKKLKKSADVV
jgi:hypothetical protein